MESCKTRGLIAKRTDYGESNCMLTILAENMGVISACAYGVRSKRSKLRAAAQPLCFCELVLSRKHGDIYRVESAEIIDSFFPICEDFVKLALANYLCELTRSAFLDGDGAVLSLLLNSLYVLAYKSAAVSLVKSVFELKIAQFSGYEPMLGACISCGTADEISAFDLSGGVKCRACRGVSDLDLDIDLYRSIKYIFEADIKKVFSFTVTADVGERLSRLAEKYILAKSEQNYKSLDYLKKII